MPDNRNTRKSCEICSQLTMKTPERSHSSASAIDLEQVHVSWDSLENLSASTRVWQTKNP